MRYAIFMVLCLAVLGACTDPADGDTPQDTVDDSDARGEFLAFFEARENNSWTATYEMSTTARGGNLPDINATHYVDGDRLRVDTVRDGVQSRTYVLDQVVIVCSNQERWICLETATPPAIGVQVEVEDAIESGNYTVRAMQERVIAGERTSCYTVTAVNREGTYCFADEGVPLFVSATRSNVTTNLTALSYELDVSEDAWELPAVLGQIPGGGEFDLDAYVTS